MSELLKHAERKKRTWEQVASLTHEPRYPMAVWGMMLGGSWFAGVVVLAAVIEVTARASQMPSFIASFWGAK